MGTPPPQNWPILVLIHLMGWLGWGYQFSPPLQTLAYSASSPCNVECGYWSFLILGRTFSWLIDWLISGRNVILKLLFQGAGDTCFASSPYHVTSPPDSCFENFKEMNRATHSFVAIIAASCKSKVLPNIPHGRQPLSFLIVFHDQDDFGRKIFVGPFWSL